MRARRAPRLAAASAGASAGSSSARPALARWAVVQLQGLKAGPATAAERQRYLELLADLTTASAEAQAATDLGRRDPHGLRVDKWAERLTLRG